MSMDWSNLFKAPDDPGIYPAEADYRPNPRSENPYVPQNWGDVVGQMLGSLGNVRRAQALLNSWNEAKAQGPEAAQAFLNDSTLPPWFKEKVLHGITPQMFDPAVRAQAQQIYQQVQSALREIYQQAASIEDPDARDKFIEQAVAGLKAAYPNWGDKIPPLPKNPGGHYAVPNVQGDPFLDQIVTLSNGKPMVNPATGKPYRYRDLPPELRAKLETQMVAGQMRQAVTQGKTLRQAAPNLASALKGTSFEAMLDQPADAFLDENGQPDLSKIEQLIANAQTERTRGASVLWVDPKTGEPVPAGTPGAIQVDASTVYSSRFGPAAQREGDKGRQESRLRFTARVNALKGQMTIINTQITRAQTVLADPAKLLGQDPTQPDSKVFWQKRLRELIAAQDKLQGQLSDLLQEDPDIGPEPPSTGGSETGSWGVYSKAALLNAIRVAEGTDTYGVQPPGKPGRAGAAQVVDYWYQQWVKAGKPGDFLAYLGTHYAPIGARNDPKGLNRNWVRNVRSALGRTRTPVLVGQANPAGSNVPPRQYKQQDYEQLAQTAFRQVQTGMAWDKFWAAISKANPGMNERLVKQVFEAQANAWKRMLKTSSRDPVDQTWRWIQRAIQKALSGSGPGSPSGDDEVPIY